MKAGFLFLRLSLLLFVLLALLSGKEMAPTASVGASRLPEHTCCKVIGTGACSQQECRNKCTEVLRGAGRCRGPACSCTFYCLQPPV